MINNENENNNDNQIDERRRKFREDLEKSVHEKTDSAVMNGEFQVTGFGFYGDLKTARERDKNVLVYSSGTYKGIKGKVMSIEKGTVVIRAAGKIVRVRLEDIRRVEIYD